MNPSTPEKDTPLIVLSREEILALDQLLDPLGHNAPTVFSRHPSLFQLLGRIQGQMEPCEFMHEN